MQDEVGERCGVLHIGKTFCAAPRTVSAVRGLLFGVTTCWEACNSAAAAHAVEVLSPASPRCGHHSNAGHCMGVSRCSIKLPHKLLPAGSVVWCTTEQDVSALTTHRMSLSAAVGECGADPLCDAMARFGGTGTATGRHRTDHVICVIKDDRCWTLAPCGRWHTPDPG